MRFVQRKSRHGVSAAWISFSDLFSQLMVISLVLALVFGLRAYAAKKKAAEADKKSSHFQAEMSQAKDEASKSLEKLKTVEAQFATLQEQIAEAKEKSGDSDIRIYLAKKEAAEATENLKKLESQLNLLKLQLAEAEEKARKFKDQMYVLSGQVVGLDPGEWLNASLIRGNRVHHVERDGKFRIVDLEGGVQNITLKVKNREDVQIQFSIDQSGLDGFKIVAGGILDRAKSLQRKDGLAIDPLTDDIVAFATADHSLLPNGERFLREEFGKTGTTGTSLLERLKADPSLRIAVVGQADPRRLHRKSYTNLGLSALRAAAVGDFLVRQLGVGAEQVMVLGLGATKEWLPPQKPGESPEEYYSRCRRILIMFAENADQALLRKVSEIN